LEIRVRSVEETMQLGFETDTGHVYEGANAPQFAVWPNPILSQAKLIESPSDWTDLPQGIWQHPHAWIFREDFFDPVTRIRRGRLYEPGTGATQPRDFAVSAHPFDHEGVRQVAAGRHYTKRLYAYFPCQTFVNRPDHGLGTTLALGQGKTASAWRVIETEVLVSSDILVTLKAFSTFGILPALEVSQIKGIERKSVERAIERVIDSAFRESSISIIEHCRNAATVVLSRWLVGQGADESIKKKDLGDVAKIVEREPYNKLATHNAAEVIRWLHPRSKANEQESKNLRLSVEEDAELAIHALGFILREVGWAK
jgi:hypothetical protein